MICVISNFRDVDISGGETYIGDSDRCDDRAQKVDEDDGTHTEKPAETAQSFDSRQLYQVVYGRIDPSPTCSRRRVSIDEEANDIG